MYRGTFSFHFLKWGKRISFWKAKYKFIFHAGQAGVNRFSTKVQEQDWACPGKKKKHVQLVPLLPGDRLSDRPGDTNGGLPGMTQPRAQRPSSLLLWNCQGRKQTWCSECQREGSAAEWTWPASCWKSKHEPWGEREQGKRLRNLQLSPVQPQKFIISPCPTDCRWLVISDLVAP